MDGQCHKSFQQIKDTSQFNEDLIKTYNEESDEIYFLEVNVQYLEKLHELHDDLPFLSERMKIEKVEKLLSVHKVIKLNHGLVLKNVHKVIEFNKNVWLKPYIDMNTDVRKKAKNDFEKDFFKLVNNAVFRKTM